MTVLGSINKRKLTPSPKKISQSNKQVDESTPKKSYAEATANTTFVAIPIQIMSFSEATVSTPTTN